MKENSCICLLFGFRDEPYHGTGDYSVPYGGVPAHHSAWPHPDVQQLQASQQDTRPQRYKITVQPSGLLNRKKNTSHYCLNTAVCWGNKSKLETCSINKVNQLSLCLAEKPFISFIHYPPDKGLFILDCCKFYQPQNGLLCFDQLELLWISLAAEFDMVLIVKAIKEASKSTCLGPCGSIDFTHERSCLQPKFLLTFSVLQYGSKVSYYPLARRELHLERQDFCLGRQSRLESAWKGLEVLYGCLDFFIDFSRPIANIATTTQQNVCTIWRSFTCEGRQTLVVYHIHIKRYTVQPKNNARQELLFASARRSSSCRNKKKVKTQSEAKDTVKSQLKIELSGITFYWLRIADI